MNRKSRIRPRQRDRLAGLLNARSPNLVFLPNIIALGIAQHDPRIFELPGLINPIESEHKGDRGWFRLVTITSPDSPVRDLERERRRENGR
jgi:hypothetical protein